MSENLYCKEQKVLTEQGRSNYDQINWNSGRLVTLYEGHPSLNVEKVFEVFIQDHDVDHFPEPNPGA